MLIGGKIVAGSQTFKVINPSTGAPFATAPHASAKEVDAAVSAASAAFKTWSRTPASDRIACLERCSEILSANSKSIAALLVKEQGKPLKFALGEIAACLADLKHAMDIAEPDTDVYSETETHRVEVKRRPIGVCAGISPWNFPLICSLPKWATAVALGNTFVLKPSPYTPLTALALGVLLKDVFPPGVLNVVSGSDAPEYGFNVGAYLTKHPQVKKVSFTGSVRTGKAIYASAANDVKRITLEMGGNDAAIVRPDVDVKKVAPAIAGGAFFNTGQVCVAIKRCFVHESIYDAFVEEIVKAASEARVGDGMDPTTQYGPLNNKMQFDRCKELFDDAVANGAKVHCGGEALPGDGYYFKPTILTGVKEGVRIVDEEQFSPILPVMAYKTEDEALERANSTALGLGGSVWGSDKAKTNALADRMECGTVWVNEHMSPTGAPFGGFKESGLGREGGKSDVAAFTEVQTRKVLK